MYKFITDIRLASTNERPLFLLDSGLNCIYSGDENLIKTGGSLLSALRERVILPLQKTHDEMLYIDGHFYLATLTPVQSDEGDDVYLCEIIGRQRAFELYTKTDAGAERLPVLNSVEFLAADLWKCLAEFRRTVEHPLLDNFENGLYKLWGALKNDVEYLDAAYSINRRTLFDVNKLCMMLHDRCNAALAKCGRCFEYVSDGHGMYVHLSGRQAVVALVNAIQNAMLYSPSDSVPLLSVKREDGCVCVCMENDSSMFTSEDFSDSVSVEFNYQRMGSGLPIIRAFAAAADGKVTFECKNGKAVLLLSLPIANRSDVGDYCLEEPFSSNYVTGVPDFVEVKMQEVVNFFKKEEVTENIQSSVT